MADKKLNEVTKVTDMAYVPVIMADGSVGQIAKADLASVVAGLLGNPMGYVNEIVNETGLDSAVKSGYYSIKSNVNTTEGNKVIYGTMLVMTTISYTSQIAFGSDGLMAIRRRDVKTGVWDSWRSIGQ